MTATKITRFLGTAPKNASELLPDTAAQVARNCKLYSGDLIPYPTPVTVGNSSRVGTTRTLHALRDPSTDELKFLTWTTDVDIVTPATDELGEQRFYYTGDGAPKVSTYAKAISGPGPYPAANGYYDLGLPLPTAQPTATATAFTPATTYSIARDASGNTTLETNTAHNLKDGTYATISGFTYLGGTYTRSGTTITCTINTHSLSTGASVFLRFTSGGATTNQYTITVTGTNTFTCSDTASGTIGTSSVELDISDFNAITEVTVINSTTISYRTAGNEFTARTYSAGKVDLGGQVQARSYLYTWYTPWLEESIGSEPSAALFIKEGQIVDVSGLPTSPPAGSNYIRGIRLYRTLSGTTDAAFYRLKTLWYPNTITYVQRTSNVTSVVFQYPHMLLEGDRFKISGCSEGSVDVTDAIVVAVGDQYSFTFAQVGSNIPYTAATGTLYYDAAEDPADAARYWGDGGDYDFTDDFNYRSLTNILTTNDYTPPPSDLQGIMVVSNNILAGFSGNDLYFSEPGAFHAWPLAYKQSFEYTIVGLATFGGNLFVLTDGYPYVVYGNDPATLVSTRLSSRYPCVSKRSIVEARNGIIYASHDGLVVCAGASGAQPFTQFIHSSDTWNEYLDPSTIVATIYKDAYFASHDASALMFDYAGIDSTGRPNPSFIDIDFHFSAAWYDTQTNNLYLASGLNGDVYQWDNLAQPYSTMTWKSKTLVTPTFDNLGAARVVADYTGSTGSSIWEGVESTWEAWDENWDTADPITFKLYVNKSLLFTTTRSDSDVFRLPAGYKSDTFEVEVSGTLRVRAIHLGNTATDLRSV